MTTRDSQDNIVGSRRRALIINPSGKTSPTGKTSGNPKDNSLPPPEVEWLRSDYVSTGVHNLNLNYPPGLHRRTLVEMDADIVETRMLGLPGELKLDKLTADKYFGGHARERFFNRSKWLSDQHNKISNSRDEELQHLYFDNEKLDTAKLVPFGPVRVKNDVTFVTSLHLDDNVSTAGASLMSGASGGSAFRSRFKQPGSETGSAHENESLRLIESAARSGMRKEDFQDDLAHPDDAFLDIPHGISAKSSAQNFVADSSYSVQTEEEGEEWDNLSEVTMTEEDVARLRKKGFYRTQPKKLTFQDQVQDTRAAGGKRLPEHASFEEVVDAVVAQNHVPTATAPTQTNSQRTHRADHSPGNRSADGSLLPSVKTVRSSVPVPLLTKEPSNSERDKSRSGGGNSSHVARPSTASAAERTCTSAPLHPHGSRRIEFLTPSPAAAPQTNATAFGGKLTNSPGIAGISIVAAANTATRSGPSATGTLAVPSSGSRKSGGRKGLRPQTAGPGGRVSADNNSSKSNTPRKEQLGATVRSSQLPRTSATKSQSKGASTAKQLAPSPKAKAPVSQEKGKRGAADGPMDVYSSLILEDLLTKKNVALVVEDEQSAVGSVSKTSARGPLNAGDEESVVTASTVSTIGLGLYLDSLEDKQRGESEGVAGQKRSVLPVPITSPRTKYLAGCMREGLNPRASLVLRKNMSKQLNLQHHGMGDQMGRLLAESIQGLPHIQSINIADNMLTDIGMGPIILAAVGIPGLLELNLSQNEIGPVSAKALFEYLVSPTCPLERLILRNADVDDFECERFVEAIKENKSLVELDLSNNKIGSAENLNTVMPDLITGGEALAELLRLPTCRLKTLKVDWNMIRLDGAIDFADALSVNSTLTYLDLSFNSLSTDGGITLGVSILSNHSLETLILASNNLDSVACFTICAGVIENRGLKKVVLDGNPIGEQGMKSLMLIPMIAGNRVKVSAARCNISIRDPRCWFNFEKLIADYDLRMEDGFHRAIAIILLHMIAGHHSFIFTKFLHEVTGRGGKTSQRKIDLVQKPSTEASQHFDRRQRFVLDGLLKMKAAASDIQTAIRLFQEVDEDNSGELDKSELKNLMGRMGIEVTEKRLTELMNQYDVDQGGKIELHEFLMLLKSQHKEAQERIKELVEAPIMVLRSDQNKQYLPPTKGILRITVADGFAKKSQYRIMSACDREYINEVTKDMSGASAATMISSSLQGTKLRLDEGLQVAQRMLEDSGDKVATIKKLVLQMNDTDDARNLITSLLENDRTEMLRLKRDFGAALRPILGNPNGYYILDLAKEMDRMCLERLLEISTTTGNKRMEASKLGYGRVGDLSQKGNWSSFRNELLDGEPVVLSPAFAQPIPRFGKLEFDFSGAGRPTRDALVVSDIRVVKLLMNNCLLHPNDCPVALYKLSVLAAAAEKTLGCEGRNYYEVQMERARLIGEHVESFYENLHLRSRHFEQTIDREGSVAVDQDGDLIDLFETEKYPIQVHVSDFMSSTELMGPVPAEIGTLGGAPAPLGRKGRPLGATTETPQKGKKKEKRSRENGSDDSDSDSSSSSSSSYSSSGSSVSRSSSSRSSRSSSHSGGKAGGGVAALKTLSYDSDPENTEEGSGAEDEDWQKTFAAMKKQYLSKAEAPELPKKTAPEKRKNIALVENPMEVVQGDEFLDRFRDLMHSHTVQSGAKAHRIVDLVEDLFARSWVYCRHLVLILECFAAHYGYIKQTKNHGTYRVDMVVSLFGRIVDLHNFEFVMKILAPSEVACVYCRLGWLNVYNPCKPEGAWELDMARREERVLAKTLCVLATNEPGDNWVFNTFRWMRSMDSMPGWELTQPWLTEDGMPMRGLLNVTYYSGEGLRKRGCRPYVSFRKALLNLVLIKEEEVVSEDMRSKPAPAVQPGDRAFQKHINLWDTYLCPEWVDPSRKR